MTPYDDEEKLEDAFVPAAPAVLQRGRACWSWVVPRCPLCGKRHSHGGGALDRDPRRLLGHRVAHCVCPGVVGSYELVEAGG